MKELTDHTDLTITKVVKGGSVVIMDVKDYNFEVHRRLNNKYHLMFQIPQVFWQN